MSCMRCKPTWRPVLYGENRGGRGLSGRRYNHFTRPKYHGQRKASDGPAAVYAKQRFRGGLCQSPPAISNVRRLTLDEQTNYPHAWTADSSAVIFESNRRGSPTFSNRESISEHLDVIVATPMTEMLPQLAPDGHFVLTTRARA